MIKVETDQMLMIHLIRIISIDFFKNLTQISSIRINSSQINEFDSTQQQHYMKQQIQEKLANQ